MFLLFTSAILKDFFTKRFSDKKTFPDIAVTGEDILQSLSDQTSVKIYSKKLNIFYFIFILFLDGNERSTYCTRKFHDFNFDNVVYLNCYNCFFCHLLLKKNYPWSHFTVSIHLNSLYALSATFVINHKRRFTRGVFRTQSNICHGVFFVKIVNGS